MKCRKIATGCYEVTTAHGTFEIYKQEENDGDWKLISLDDDWSDTYLTKKQCILELKEYLAEKQKTKETI